MVQQRNIALYQPRLLEDAYTPETGRLREIDARGQVDIADATVAL